MVQGVKIVSIPKCWKRAWPCKNWSGINCKTEEKVLRVTVLLSYKKERNPGLSPEDHRVGSFSTGKVQKEEEIQLPPSQSMSQQWLLGCSSGFNHLFVAQGQTNTKLS